MTNESDELRTIADTIEQNGGWRIAAIKVRGAADEIERLRAANAQMLEHGREMWADVERLRAAMIRCRDDLKNGLTALCLERLENSCRSVEPSAAPGVMEALKLQASAAAAVDALNPIVRCPTCGMGHFARPMQD